MKSGTSIRSTGRDCGSDLTWDYRKKSNVPATTKLGQCLLGLAWIAPAGAGVVEVEVGAVIAARGGVAVDDRSSAGVAGPRARRSPLLSAGFIQAEVQLTAAFVGLALRPRKKTRPGAALMSQSTEGSERRSHRETCLQVTVQFFLAAF